VIKALLVPLGAVLTLLWALLCGASVSCAQTDLPVPPGGDRAMACGQKPDGRAYWMEYAFCDLAVRGPRRAKGLILWSHGVDGNKPQYTARGTPLMRLMANAGWDVVKIDRNNLYERTWTSSGLRHVQDLIERAKAARTQGYERVIAAGQSYGGAISVEANARSPGLFYAVLAASPGHGSDAVDDSVTRGAYYTLDKSLLDALAGQRSGRVVVSLPPLDAYHPNRDGDPIWPKVRATLAAAGQPFVLIGEGSPISGHGAASTSKFSTTFGACIQTFLDPARTPSGETRCPPS
jgi:pimeloyl-ACP methyl ester carboxylesterase